MDNKFRVDHNTYEIFEKYNEMFENEKFKNPYSKKKR